MEVQEQNAKVGANKDVYAVINDKIIAQLENGTVPWRKPGSGSGIPRNMITDRPYRGINLLLLAMEAYEDNRFITFKQLKEIGGKVRKGETGHMIVYWGQTQAANEEPKETADESDEQKKRPILRYYYVFNVSQCENVPEKYLPKEREVQEMPSCEAIVHAMPKCPPIRHKEQQAFYNVKDDFVNMPKKKSFKDDAAYYSTLFHELVHSTGHTDRLNRDTIVQMAEFGGELYSQEELVAEIGTCYLQSHAGIKDQFLASTAYIHSWLSKLKNDKRFIFIASKAAQRAVDFILNIKSDADDRQPQDE